MKKYVEQLEQLLKLQPNDVKGIGTDLPFWGESYFTEEKGVRVLIVGKESKVGRAGSIVFHANYMNELECVEYEKKVNEKKYRDYKYIKDFIEQLGLDWEFVYITDARKQYTEDAFKYKLKDSDTVEDKKMKLHNMGKILKRKKASKLNKNLLSKEIEIADPDMIFILGADGLDALGSKAAVNANRADSKEVLGGKVFYIANFPCARNNCTDVNSINYVRTVTNNRFIKNFKREYEELKENKK